MIKQEMIKRHGLTKTKTKAHFKDGRKNCERTVYINDYGCLYVFYDNDLHHVTPYNKYYDGIEQVEGKIGLGFNCYRDIKKG